MGTKMIGKILTGTLVTVMTSWTKETAYTAGDACPSQVYASASRSFQEARELLSRLKSARGYFLVVGLAQPPTDRKPAKSRA